jgi:SAM-dependent methyltransferase
MNLSDLHFLLTAEGQTILAETAVVGLTPDNHLQLAMSLRERLGAARAAAVLETVALRQRAAVKFSRANQMYFERAALEQASAEIVAHYRAARYVQMGARRLADLGCGIGGDALAFALHTEFVVGIDIDLLRLAMARENLRAYGLDGRFHPLQADLVTLPPMPLDAIFADPARRDERGRRAFSVHDYQPPLTYLDKWRRVTPHVGVKISPGVDYAELPAEAEVEFISVNGELREGALWYGALRSSAGRRATLLPGGHTLTDEMGGEAAVTPVKDYLCEPDAAVIRAHLVQPLAAQLGASKIDDNIAYLTSERPTTSPFVRCYQVEEVLPFQLKRLRAHLRARKIGRLIIKKRGSPLEVETLRRQLRLQGDEERFLFLTQVGGVATAVIARLL